VSSNACTNQTMTFAQPWNTAALEVAPPLDTTITNGDYNLALAAVPSGQETLLLAGTMTFGRARARRRRVASGAIPPIPPLA